ncbi:18132_t:CDS:2 [Entrophospora sp. SA101]|nr:18132_t:CDS:2 [Entrophospora sp. SA101]
MLFIVKKQHEDSVIVRTVIPLNDVQYNLEIFLVKNKYTGQKVDFERNHHREKMNSNLTKKANMEIFIN